MQIKSSSDWGFLFEHIPVVDQFHAEIAACAENVYDYLSLRPL